MNLQHRQFNDKKHLLNTMEQELIRLFTARTDSDYAVVLSGGNTPLNIYRSITNKAITCSAHLNLTLSDERYVQADDPLNNASYLIPMLRSMNLPPERFIRVQTHHPQCRAADLFEQHLKQWQDRQIPIELAMLGIGPDGHTASLFSELDIAHSEGHLAIPVMRPTPPNRISTTPQFLCSAKRIIILAAGSEKAAIVDTLLTNPHSIPCGLALKQAQHVELWTCD